MPAIVPKVVPSVVSPITNWLISSFSVMKTGPMNNADPTEAEKNATHSQRRRRMVLVRLMNDCRISSGRCCCW